MLFNLSSDNVAPTRALAISSDQTECYKTGASALPADRCRFLLESLGLIGPTAEDPFWGDLRLAQPGAYHISSKLGRDLSSQPIH